MLALVEILNNTPKNPPEVAALEHLCAGLAKVTASSSNIIWRYHQLIASLPSAMAHGERPRPPTVWTRYHICASPRRRISLN